MWIEVRYFFFTKFVGLKNVALVRKLFVEQFLVEIYAVRIPLSIQSACQKRCAMCLILFWRYRLPVK